MIISSTSLSAIAQASFYLEGLEKEIERITILQYDCWNDEDLINLPSGGKQAAMVIGKLDHFVGNGFMWNGMIIVKNSLLLRRR